MAEQSGEKTEEPTPHRLREAREKGQVAKSKEITTALLVFLAYAVLRYTGSHIWQSLQDMFVILFQAIPESHDFSMEFIAFLFFTGFGAFFAALAPIFLITFLVALLVEALQTGFIVSADPLTPKVERLNPMEGFKRMFSMSGLVELVKSIFKILIVGWITFRVIQDNMGNLIQLIDQSPWAGILLTGSIAFTIAMRVGVFYLFIALLDYLYRRYEYMKNLKMSKQEIKEEYKRLEGDPLVKQRIRNAQVAAAQQRMMGSVPKADVVVTNPIHLAVALKYMATQMKSPKVVAKGERLIAEEIKRIAEEAGVPIVENEPLARAVFKTTAIGQEIPYHLFQAVAEVLAFVYKLQKDRKSATRRPRSWGSTTPAPQPAL